MVKGYEILKWTGQSWEVIGNVGAIRISVDPDGNPWIIQKGGWIMHWKNDEFVGMPGRARDISVGAEGSVYVIGYNTFKKGHGIWKLKLSEKGFPPSWIQQSGYGKRITVDEKGFPWVVTDERKIYRKTPKKWKLIKGRLDDISIGPEGSVVGVR